MGFVGIYQATDGLGKKTTQLSQQTERTIVNLSLEKQEGIVLQGLGTEDKKNPDPHLKDLILAKEAAALEHISMGRDGENKKS